jgi:hypothetical protein
MTIISKTFANRKDQVDYMISLGLNSEDPLPANSTLSFAIPRWILSKPLEERVSAVITILRNSSLEICGYSVSAPNTETKDYILDNDKDLKSCANSASTQIDNIIGKKASSSRAVTVTIP